MTQETTVNKLWCFQFLKVFSFLKKYFYLGSIHFYKVCLMSFLFPILHFSIFCLRHRWLLSSKREKETALVCQISGPCNPQLGWVSVALFCLFSPSLEFFSEFRERKDYNKGCYKFTFCYTSPQKSTMVEYHCDSLVRFRFFYVGLMLLIPSQSQMALKKGNRA